MSVVRKKQRPAASPGDYNTSALVNAPQQRRSQERSLRILEGAERVLRRHGLAAFTIGAVALEAGVSVGGIYGRFKDREELLSAIHTGALSRIRQALEGLAERKFDNLVEVAEAFATELVDVFQIVGDLMPGVTSAHLPTVLSTERAIRTALVKAAHPFHDQIKHPDPDMATRITVHLLLASVVREAATDPAAVDRAMGWETLRRELPRVARAMLTGSASPRP